MPYTQGKFVGLHGFILIHPTLRFRKNTFSRQHFKKISWTLYSFKESVASKDSKSVPSVQMFKKLLRCFSFGGCSFVCFGADQKGETLFSLGIWKGERKNSETKQFFPFRLLIRSEYQFQNLVVWKIMDIEMVQHFQSILQSLYFKVSVTRLHYWGLKKRF